MSISSIGLNYANDSYTTASTGSSTAQSLPDSSATQDSVILQLESSLTSSTSQSDTSNTVAAGYPTSIQQAVQNQALLATNPDLAATLSQTGSSSSLTDILQSLSGESGSTQTDQTLATLASSMQTLKNLTNTGTLADSPALVQSLLQICNSQSNIASTGSIVDKSA
jgi:hypothetical protein